MDFFIDFTILGLLIIATTAFLGFLGHKALNPFSKKAGESVTRTDHTQQGWRGVGGKQEQDS